MIIVLAWLAFVVMVFVNLQAIRLHLVPAGDYGPWRLAWTGLVFGITSETLLVLRNALTLSDIADESWPVLMLANYSVRVVLTLSSAIGFLICTTLCLRIFRFHAVPASAPVVQIIMDWRGIVREWSPEASKLLGWGASETVGQELAGLLIPADPMIDGSSPREVVREHLHHFRETGESPLLNVKVPLTVLHQTGARLAVESYITAHITSQGTRFLVSLFPIVTKVPEV